MSGYVGSSKRYIEDLIESVQEPGVNLRREKRAKSLCPFMVGPNIVYRFYKDGKKLFFLCVLQKAGDENIEMSINRDSVFSEPIREGDEGYRKACVLHQLAEKMYETQHKMQHKALKRSIQAPQIEVFCSVFKRNR